MFARHDSECFYAVGRERFIVGDFRRTDAVDGMFLSMRYTWQRTAAKSPTFNLVVLSRYRHSCSVLHQLLRAFSIVFDQRSDTDAIGCAGRGDDDIHHLLA